MQSPQSESTPRRLTLQRSLTPLRAAPEQLSMPPNKLPYLELESGNVHNPLLLQGLLRHSTHHGHLTFYPPTKQIKKEAKMKNYSQAWIALEMSCSRVLRCLVVIEKTLTLFQE